MTLTTVVHHVCEKTGDIHIPDVTTVYTQILAANDSKYANVLLLPELNGHAVWADELAWIAANFDGAAGIPVMLDVFGGGSGVAANPQLSTAQISAAIAVANVKWVRFAEVVSWHLEHPAIPFPTAYVVGILSFCRTNGLKVFWCEWKVDSLGVDTFKAIQTYIVGYEDIVTVAFKTNSGDLEPAAGFKYIKDMGFTHIGAVVESWYWETRHRDPLIWEPSAGLGDPDNMPISWMVTHAAEAKGLGAEVIQFEPYWYFFEDLTGVARVSLQRMHYFLNSQMANMENSAVILQTLMAEWFYGPAKADVSWLEGRVSTVAGWDIQPSTHDFSKLTKKYAVSCYSSGNSSPTGNLWLKCEVVAVDILVKVLGTTLDKASLIRESMRVEVERILYMYSKVAPLWDPVAGPIGAPHRRRIPGLADVVISLEVNQTDDSSLARVTVQVKCRIFPRKSWV